MNILIINPELPYPKHKNGNCIIIGNMIEYWYKENEIKFLYFKERDLVAENVIKEKFNIECEYIDISSNEYFYVLNKKVFLKPRNTWAYNFQKVNDIDVGKYDQVILGSFAAAFFIKAFKNSNKNPKITYLETDALTLYYKRSMERTSKIINKFYFFCQMNIISQICEVFYKYVDDTIYVSEVDKKYIQSTVKDKTLNGFKTINLGVTVDKVRDKPFDTINQHVNLCFSGVMDYQPNKEAVEYILKELVPMLKEKNIPFKFHIVGKNPQSSWSNNKYVESGDVIVTGFLENIDEYLAEMDIYISPLFLGTGMKNKILQAMAIGLPIVCSRVSVEGINELVDKNNVFLCGEDPGEWINQINLLIRKNDELNSISSYNKGIIEKYYSWEKASNKVLGIK